MNRRGFLSFLGALPAMPALPASTSSGGIWNIARSVGKASSLWYDNDDGEIYRFEDDELVFKQLAWDADPADYVRRADGLFAHSEAYLDMAKRYNAKHDQWLRSVGVQPTDSYEVKRAKYRSFRAREIRKERADKRIVRARQKVEERNGRRAVSHSASYGERAAMDWFHEARHRLWGGGAKYQRKTPPA